MSENTSKDKWQSLTHLLDLPPDLTLDLPKITLIGNIQLIIENHRGLIEFSATKTVINTNRWPLVLTGQNLLVRSIRVDELMIEGLIETISFGL
ncbi:MAG: sporulation protein YqfC [Syntrophomonadaceae bacterium]|nr:sporulation protein YqfC [Syntrophomonadaceae bacterium]